MTEYIVRCEAAFTLQCIAYTASIKKRLHAVALDCLSICVLLKIQLGVADVSWVGAEKAITTIPIVPSSQYYPLASSVPLSNSH